MIARAFVFQQTLIAAAAPHPPSVLLLSWLQTFLSPVHSINRLDHLTGTLWKMSSFSHQCHIQILHISLQDKISPSTATPSRLCSSGHSHHQSSSPLDWLPGCRHSMFKSTGPEDTGSNLFFVYNQTKSKNLRGEKHLGCNFRHLDKGFLQGDMRP